MMVVVYSNTERWWANRDDHVWFKREKAARRTRETGDLIHLSEEGRTDNE